MFIAQEEKCAICKTAPPKRKRLVIDHDHTSGKVRGLLCQNCNLALGALKDDVGRLREAIVYLKENGK